MLSLLLKVPDDGPEVECLKDLALDQIVSSLCLTGDLRAYVLSVLKQPLQDRENVLFRQEICRDFFNHPELHQELSQICRDYVLLKKDWDEAVARHRTKTSAAQAISQSLDYVRDTISALEVNAIFCGKIAAFPETFLAALNKYALQSRGLLQLKTVCEERLADPGYQRLRQIAAELSEVAPMITRGCEICVEMQESLHAQQAHLVKAKTGTEEHAEREPSLLGALFGRTAKPAEKEMEAGMSLDGITRRELVSLINEALKETNGLLVEIAQSIYAAFADLADELWFYRFALKLKQVYEKEKVPFCFPDIKPAQEDVFEFKELYDLLLLVKDAERRYPLRNIVPNDARLGSATTGLLVQGANGTGKTTFLRAVGIGQILAQAGLPVPARSAVISMRRRILAQFSGEDTLSAADSAGRFEGEVQEVAGVIAMLEPYSLVLFNETFQTTAFDEAAAAVFDILDVISEARIKWVFVTHLTQLYGLLAASGRKVQFLQTSTDDKRRYQVEQIKTAGDS
jgi:DNA mismatch repair protein MutS